MSSYHSEKTLFIFIFLVGILTTAFLISQKNFLNIADADNAATSVVVAGVAPNITDGPSDGGITSTNPVNVGSDVTFTVTANDDNGDQYYLAICKTDAITANNNATPTCTGGAWCYSGKTNDDAQASCSTTTLAAWEETSDWFAFVCDYSASSQCSASSQGTGNNGSPFHVNHRPTFTALADTGPKNPGQSVTIYTTSSDADSEHSDQVFLLVCRTDGISGTQCDGGNGDTWCSSSLTASDANCSFTLPTPAPHGATTSYAYIFDSHNFAASGGSHGTDASVTINDVAPTVSSVVLNGGRVIALDAEGTAGATTTVTTMEVTDNNGCADVTGVTTSVYRSSATCTAQDNNSCYYNQSCSGDSVCDSGITQTYNCNTSIKYHADPTDVGTPYAAQNWLATGYALDQIGQGTADSSGVELNTWLALDVTNAINYGSLAVGEIADGTALPQYVTVQATGNCGLDTNISGNQMTSGANSIATSSQKYATSAVAYSAATALQADATELELNLAKTTSTATLSDKKVYWGLQIPNGTQPGSYSGTNSFTAVKGETADW
ncbi:hypothetical protein KBC01_01245 [Candidatus Parcubacteria bacterium]|nr:hypothetical protein [Candidatus Parcubacteria bacterium]